LGRREVGNKGEFVPVMMEILWYGIGEDECVNRIEYVKIIS